MSLLYIAGPYTAPTLEQRRQNVRRAEEIGQKVLALGLIPVIPHKITEGWDDWGELVAWKHQDWIRKFCLPLLLRCDGVLFTPGWETSKGCKDEHDFAVNTRIPRFYSIEQVQIISPAYQEQ